MIRRLAVLFAAGAAGVALAATLAAQGGRFSDALDIATHFAPVWLALALVGAGLAASAARGKARTAILAAAAAACVLAGTLIAPEYLAAQRPAAAAAGAARLKLVQFNAWRDQNPDPAGAARWLIAQDADVLVVEEAVPVLRAALQAAGYHMTCERPDGCIDAAIFSRAKPVAQGTPALTVGEPFPAVCATFAAPDGRRFTVVGVHFTWPLRPGDQQNQGRRLAELLGRFPKDATILAGDLNSTPWSFTRQRQDAAFGLERRTRAVWSWPVRIRPNWPAAPFPFLPIDHAFAGTDWRTVSTERGPALGSDHYPVTVTLQLAD